MAGHDAFFDQVPEECAQDVLGDCLRFPKSANCREGIQEFQLRVILGSQSQFLDTMRKPLQTSLRGNEELSDVFVNPVEIGRCWIIIPGEFEYVCINFGSRFGNRQWRL